METISGEVIRVQGKTSVERGEALKAAIAEANTLLKASWEAPVELTLLLEDGEYLLAEPLSVEDTFFSKLTIRAAKDARPVLTGAVKIPDSAFEKVEGREYYVAQLDTDQKVRDVFVKEKRIPLASGKPFWTITDFENPEDRKDPANAKGLYLHKEAVEQLGEVIYPTEVLFCVEWEFYRLHVTGVDLEDTKTAQGFKIVDGKRVMEEQELVRVTFDETELMEFSQNIHKMLPLWKGRKYYFENNISLLAPGTCVCDYDKGLIYYYPEEGKPTGVTYSIMEQLLVFKKAENVTLEGIAFTGTACTLTAESGYQSGQANTECRKGALKCSAVLLDKCTNFVFRNCTFKGLGTNGIISVNRAKKLTIEDCLFDDIAMSAIAIGNHTTWWDEDTAVYDVTIHNNIILNIGMEYPSATAIYISHVDGLKLTHNTIHNTAYSGVSIGWGWSMVPYQYGEKINIRHADVSYNHITDFMRKLRDGAAIYVLGANCTVEYTELFNEMHHNFAKNPDQYHRGYYLDGSSSNWYVHDNVISGALHPLFSQFIVEQEYNHNVKSERIYSTDKINLKNHAPERNVILGEVFEAKTLEELFEKYPKAKEIEEAAGAK